MLQTDILNVEEYIENLLLKNKAEDGNSNYLMSLTCFLSCLFTKIMEKESLIDTCESDAPLFRYEKGETLIHAVFGNNISTQLFQESREKSSQAMVASFLAGCDDLFATVNIDAKDIGHIFESFYNKDYNSISDALKSTSGRKEAGMFFSRPEMVQFIIKAVTDNKNRSQISKSSFLDPSMGGGIFIFELLEYVDAKRINIKNFLENRVFGIDRNPLIVDIVRISLWIKYHAETIDISKLCSHIRQADSLILFGDASSPNTTWATMFPDVFTEGGFNYVIGNPPWGKIKANVRDFSLLSNNLAKQHQGASLKSQMEQDDLFEDWEKYKARISLYAETLKQNPAFQHQKYMIGDSSTGGDFDLYKYFLEMSYAVLCDGGKLGYIIPASFYISESATGLRHLYLENGTINYLVNFINKKRIFPIHTSYKFLLLVYSKHTGRKEAINKAVFNLTDSAELTDFKKFKKRKFISYSVSYLEKCSKDYWTIPEFENECEKNLLLKLYNKADDINRANKCKCQVSYNRELDMTLDSSIFIPCIEVPDNTAQNDAVPVYEGRMVNQYDSNHKIYISGAGRTAVWKINPFDDRKPVRAQYYVRKNEISGKYIGEYRACYCEITGQNNVRTILASLIPPDVICGNKVPTCQFEPDNSIKYHLYWVGIANSFIIDWVMRKKMTITINFFHWTQIPFPYVDINSLFARQVVAASAIILNRQNGYDTFKLLEREHDSKILRQYKNYDKYSTGNLRLIIDCNLANIMGLTLAELINILYGFPSLDHGKKGIIGDRRYNTNTTASYATRDLLLYRFMKSRHCNVDQNIVDIFARAGLDISDSTGTIKNLADRANYYIENDINPYQKL